MLRHNSQTFLFWSYPRLHCIINKIALKTVVPAFADDYTVGDSSGWATGVDFSTWTSGKTFKVGDTLLFQYNPLHTVNEVSKSDYDACSASNSIQSYSDQNTKITLDKAGDHYFICGTPGHCSGGMKLTVSVANSGAPSSPSTPSSGGSSPATPSTPSSTPSSGGSSPATPSTPSSTPSTPSGTPSEPSSKQTPSATSGANAPNGKVFSGVMVGMSLVGLGLMG